MTNSRDDRVMQMLQHIHEHLFHEEHGLAAILASQRHIERRIKRIMTVADDIKAALADLSAETAAESDLLAAIDTKMNGLTDQIGVLQQQITDLTAGGNGGLSAADVAEVQASLAALKTATDANKAKEEILANTPQPPTP